MIDEKALIKIFEQKAEMESRQDGIITYEGGIHSDGVADGVRWAIDTTKAQPKTGEWIPCSERQPDKADNYLITVSSFDETASIEYETVEHCNSDGTWLHYSEPSERAKRGSRVVAWMPLPEPWEGEK